MDIVLTCDPESNRHGTLSPSISTDASQRLPTNFDITSCEQVSPYMRLLSLTWACRSVQVHSSFPSGRDARWLIPYGAPRQTVFSVRLDVVALKQCRRGCCTLLACDHHAHNYNNSMLFFVSVAGEFPSAIGLCNASIHPMPLPATAFPGRPPLPFPPSFPHYRVPVLISVSG